ncbi:MAG TPA: D-glycero-beta-D-manno-heptose-7-phosphate kinase [Blastocatellia bacterium]|nr:D-glycero-beta-D-manno-heptose-7-phosphate kinase [Blastocatellia bacterium]
MSKQPKNNLSNNPDPRPLTPDPCLARERAAELIGAFDGKRIIVLGDVMLDEFIWGRVRRISPEAPVPVVEVERQTLALGGAGNVVSNLIALGARAIPLGVVGDDADADRLRRAFKDIQVSDEGLIVDRSRPTTLKTRIIAHNQQVVRADRENRAAINEEIEDQVITEFHRLIETADAMVVSDYNKGLLTKRLLGRALPYARERGVTVCLDPKLRSFAHYQPVTVITPNNQEAAEAAGIPIEDEASLIEAGQKLLAEIDCRAVLVTRGEEGMTLFTDGGDVTHIPTVAREVYDVTGAGDTVVATLALALTTGASLVEAAVLANHAAGVVVGKVGTAAVSRDELLATI